jgi:hypothetical protein
LFAISSRISSASILSFLRNFPNSVAIAFAPCQLHTACT